MNDATVMYQHVGAEERDQNTNGTLIVEIDGTKYRCVFHLDRHYAFQCRVVTSVFSQERGWLKVLEQQGTENPLCAMYHGLVPPEQGKMQRDGTLEAAIVNEMHRLCRFAAEVNA